MINLSKRLKSLLQYGTLGILLSYTIPLESKAQDATGTPGPSGGPPGGLPGDCPRAAAMQAAANASTMSALTHGGGHHHMHHGHHGAMFQGGRGMHGGFNQGSMAAEQASHHAGNCASMAAQQAAQHAGHCASMAAEQAAQHAGHCASMAAQQAAQQASHHASIAANQAARHASHCASMAAEQAAHHAGHHASMAALSAEQAAHQACNLSGVAASQAAHQHFHHHHFRHNPGNIAAFTAGENGAARGFHLTRTICQPQMLSATETQSQSTVNNLSNLNSITQTTTDLSSLSGLTGLNFSSDLTSYTAPNTTPVTITVGGQLSSAGSVVGGTSLTVNPGDHITAGQLEAVEHVMTFGSQSVLLNGQGQAIGGYITLTSQDLSSAGNLYVPESVSLSLINFNAASPLTISDSVNILGSVYSIQDTANQASILNFGSLNIGSTGLLSGALPTIDLFSNYFASSSLTINVLTSVLNAGTITSPGALNINAGTTITNSGLLSANSVSLAANQAIHNAGTIAALAGNVNLNSVSGQYFNTGTISALNNINIANQSAAALANINFDNTGGLLKASEAVNFRATEFMQKADLAVSGGDIYSKEVNLNGGNGKVTFDVHDVNGVVNATGYDVQINADTDTLTLGTLTGTGDPRVSNT
ncbi:MAG: hypothetical protein KC652_19650, partial [Cyanobacteria bacterium HKST-UBA01]|nr:hypothetical protein [Cyanobacteria bacterium HKST-UBA01]